MKKELQRANDLLTEAAGILDAIVSDRQDTWESRSERWQESDRGVDHEDLTSRIENAKDEAESAATVCEEAIEES